MAYLGPELSEGGFSAAEISRRWREVLGSGSNNVFAGQFPQSMNMPDFSRFSAPIMDAIRQQAAAMPDTPAFGPGREQQERWQALLQDQLEHHQAQSRYQALLGQVMEPAFGVFGGKLAEHEERKSGVWG